MSQRKNKKEKQTKREEVAVSRLKWQWDKHLEKLGKAAEEGEPCREGPGMFRVPGQAEEARGNVRKGWTGLREQQQQQQQQQTHHRMGISLPILRSLDITHQREPSCFWMSKRQRNPIDMGFERNCCQRDALRNIHISV